MDWNNVTGKIGRAHIKVRTYTNNLGEEKTEIKNAIDDVQDSNDRVVLVCRYLQFKSNTEIAEIMGVTRKTVDNRWMEGLQHIVVKDENI